MDSNKSRTPEIDAFITSHLIKRNTLIGADPTHGFTRDLIEDVLRSQQEKQIYLDVIETHKSLLEIQIYQVQLEIEMAKKLPITERKIKLIDLMEKMEDLTRDYEVVYG